MVAGALLSPDWRFRSTWRGKLILQRLVDRVQYCPHTSEGTPYKTWVDATVEDMDAFYAHFQR